MNEKNLRPPFSPSEAREMGARGGASPKRRATLDAKKLMKKMLNAYPAMSKPEKEQLKAMGMDLQDADSMTNAALLAAKVIQQARDGDLEAIKMAFEMAGQAVTARDQNERERVAVEREKVRLMERGTAASAAGVPVLIDTRPEESEADGER